MMTTVKQLLEKKPGEIFSVTPDTLVIDAIKIMDNANIGVLLVLENSNLEGIMSERDYTRKVILNNRSSSTTRVSEIMTSGVKTIKLDNTADECLRVMSENHIRHLPVVENNKVVGILSIMDVVKTILKEKEFIIDQLNHYITDTA
jgi:CBS domain-containing protein